MARLIWKWKTVVRDSQSPKVLIVCHRHRSSEAMKSKWVEIDGVKLLEDHAHRVMVMKATPDWLPFLPGSSFWVPPPPSPFLHKFSIPSQPFLLQGSLFFHSLFIPSMLDEDSSFLCSIVSLSQQLLPPHEGRNLLCNSRLWNTLKMSPSLKTRKDDHDCK